MASMLAYNLNSTLNTPGAIPTISVGQGPGQVILAPANPSDNSYWICILNAETPTTKVAEMVVPAANNSAAPALLQKYASDPTVIIALITQNLYSLQVPQGDFFNLLTQLGAGRELQSLEQYASTRTGSGSFINVSYVFTAQGGTNFCYEQSSMSQRVQYMMSMMTQGGQYTLCDAYTFLT
jgi:hypothetical protein